MNRIPCLGERLTVAGGGRFLLERAQDTAEALLGDYEGRAQLIYLDITFEDLIQFNYHLDSLPLAG